MCMYKVLKPLEGSAFVRRLISCWLTPGSNMIQDQPGNGGGGGMRFCRTRGTVALTALADACAGVL